MVSFLWASCIGFTKLPTMTQSCRELPLALIVKFLTMQTMDRILNFDASRGTSHQFKSVVYCVVNTETPSRLTQTTRICMDRISRLTSQTIHRHQEHAQPPRSKRGHVISQDDAASIHYDSVVGNNGLATCIVCRICIQNIE